MNKKLSLFFGRRSIRAYSSATVEKSTVLSLLQAAMAAPSTCAKDPWRYVIVHDSVMRARIAEGLPNGKMLIEASVGIVVCGDISAAHDNQLSYMIQDCSAAIENILLAAHTLGLGACWLGIHPREDRILHIRNLLQIPDPVIPW